MTRKCNSPSNNARVGIMMFGLIKSKVSNYVNKRGYASVKWTSVPLKFEYKQNEKTKISTLSSGLRVVTHKVAGPTATIGFFIDSGSRAENEQNNGVAHFFEHMAFKGTTNMSQYDMETLVENIGTKLFAYTSREQTVYYGKCFINDGEKVVQILSDIIQRPLLADNAIERERGVILREMEDIETQIDEVVFDHLHGTAYQATPLGFTILGPSENIKKISRNDLQNYIKHHYTADRIVMIAVGDVDHEEYVKLAQKHLSQIPPTSTGGEFVKWYKPAKYLGSGAYFRNDDMPHAHVAYGFEGVPATHPDFIPLMLATSYLGSYDQSSTTGKFMSTLLARESAEHDIVRAYSSFYAAYKDTALWGVYFTGKKTSMIEFMITLTHQIKRLRNNLSDGAVQQAKNTLKTNYLMQIDGTTNLFEEIGRQILTYGRRITNEEFEQEIDRCDTETVEKAMMDMMDGRCPVIVAIGPIEAVPDYTAVRNLTRSFLT